MKLYSYFRSSAAYRVRIALNLKGIEYEQIPVNLVKNEQSGSEYKAKNPQGLVPALQTEQGTLGQSLAIMEWLEVNHPEPALLPGDSWQQAKTRSLAYSISCDIHPLDNLRVLKYLSGELEVSDQKKNTWYRHWINIGFAAFEQQCSASPYSMGGEPSLADVCLVPQVYNALRFNVDMTAFAKIVAINDSCNSLPAFEQARPEKQADSTLS